MIALQIEMMRLFCHPIQLGAAADWVEEQPAGGGINAQLLAYWLRAGRIPTAIVNSNSGSGSGSGFGDSDNGGFGFGFGFSFGSGSGSGFGSGFGSGSDYYGDYYGSGYGPKQPQITIEDFMPQIDQYVIARGRGSGCTFGKYQGHHGEEVTLTDARTIWNWSGRLHIVGVSQTRSTADNVRLTRSSGEIIVTDCCQVIAPASGRVHEERSSKRSAAFSSHSWG